MTKLATLIEREKPFAKLETRRSSKRQASQCILDKNSVYFGMENPMLPSAVVDLKAFVPSRDLELSKTFYTDLGFTINWSNSEITEMQIGSFRFLIQKFYVAQHAGNFMMSLAVENADLWWEHIQQQELAKKYPGITCKPPAMQPWGLRVLYLSDPTGVLWHIVDNRRP